MSALSKEHLESRIQQAKEAAVWTRTPSTLTTEQYVRLELAKVLLASGGHVPPGEVGEILDKMTSAVMGRPKAQQQGALSEDESKKVMDGLLHRAARSRDNVPGDTEPLTCHCCKGTKSVQSAFLGVPEPCPACTRK